MGEGRAGGPGGGEIKCMKIKVYELHKEKLFHNNCDPYHGYFKEVMVGSVLPNNWAFFANQL
jgi:hypothetical protein